MQPEISHRCSSCGASIRSGAMFCPECGKAVTQERAQDEPVAPEVEEPVSEAVAAVETAEAAPTTPPSAPIESSDESTAAETHADASVSAKAVGKTRERLHRASNVARDALEDNVKRVEKIRHVSTAVLEEASYDPSLRFVLVALGIFIVFVILLILSKVMG